MTELVSYAPTMAFKGFDFPTCSASTFVERLENSLSSFEFIPNDANVKYYFDVDVKNITYNNNTANAIENKCVEYITGAFEGYIGITPKISIATSHSTSKYSFHFYISNLLDKKSNMKSFVKKLNQYIKMKEDIDNIYDYIEETDNGLFDEAVYGSNQKIRCVNTSKPNEDRPLLLKEGKIEDTIISAYFDNDATIVNYQCDSPTSVVTNFEPINFTGNKDDKYLNLLFNVIGNGKHIDFNTWFHIAGILKCNNYPFEILREYTNIYDKENPKTEKLWNSIDNSRPFAIFGLQNIAKKVNENGYFQWLQKYCEYISLDILSAGANDICQFISKSLKNTLIYSKNGWVTCNKQNLWVEIKDPSAIIVSAIQAEIDKTMKLKTDLLLKPDTTDEVKEKLRADIKQFVNYRVASNAQMNAYAKLLTTYLSNDDFHLILDTNKYEVAFRNGMLDLKTLVFRNGILPTDFLTKTIPYDYVKSNEATKQLVRNEIKKITNNNEEHLNYYLSILGYAMTGDASRLQEFYYLLGQKACNGKSVIFEALTDIMPNYVIKTGNDIFEKNNTTIHKELARFNGIRIAWANELTKNKQDVDRIKDMADGNSISYKALYKNSTILNILCKIFVVSNHTLSFDVDEGLKRRLKSLQLDSEFIANLVADEPEKCRFIRDNSFGIKLRNEYKFALLDLIFEYSKQFVDDNYTLKHYPNEWKEESNNICESENHFKEWFENNFVFGDYEISEYKLKQILKANKFDVKFTDENKKNRWNFKRNKDSKSWIGFKMIDTIEKE